MAKVVNIEKCFEKFNDTYSPKIVGELNGQLVMVVRLEGDKVPWHTHDKEDEMFFLVDGILDIFERIKILRCIPANFTLSQEVWNIVLSLVVMSSLYYLNPKVLLTPER